MDELGPVTEHEMVLAFLSAEIDSPTWGERYKRALRDLGLTRAVIDAASTGDSAENRQRAAILGMVRGYPNEALFRGLPRGTVWRRVRLQPSEIQSLRYGCMEGWISLAGGTRSVAAAGTNVLSLTTADAIKVNAVAAKVKAGATFPPLITVEGDGGDLILLEGYTRATAYATAKITWPIEALVGKSSGMRAWHWY